MSVNSISLHFLIEHPKDAARALEQFEPENLAAYMENVPAETAASIIKYIVPSVATECLKLLSIEKSSQIIMHLGVERGSLLLRRMKESIREQFIHTMSPVFSNMTRLVLRYPEGTVGQVMNPNVFSVHQNMTVNEVINVIKKSAPVLQNEIFITDDKQELAGIVNVKELLTSDDNQNMKTIMKLPGESIPARARLDSFKNKLEWNYTENLPVIDHMGVFIGVLNRVSVHEAMSDGEKSNNEGELAGTAMAVAELFWEAFADMLSPSHQDNSNKGNQDE